MDNFSPNADRRHVVDASALNSFLSKMYSIMGLAVLVSALTAYLTLTVGAGTILPLLASSRALVWILLFLPIILSVAISFNATRRPTASFLMLMAIAVIYGVEFSTLAFVYTGTSITAAFVSAAGVFAGMAFYGSVTKRSLDNFGAYANAALIGLIVAMLVNFFVKSGPASFVFSVIAVIIFTVLTAYDAQKMKQIYQTYGDQVSSLGLAVNGALLLYLDFVNLFLELLQIFGYSDSKN